jgi:hypothetical protein
MVNSDLLLRNSSPRLMEKNLMSIRIQMLMIPQQQKIRGPEFAPRAALALTQMSVETVVKLSDIRVLNMMKIGLKHSVSIQLLSFIRKKGQSEVEIKLIMLTTTRPIPKKIQALWPRSKIPKRIRGICIGNREERCCWNLQGR